MKIYKTKQRHNLSLGCDKNFNPFHTLFGGMIFPISVVAVRTSWRLESRYVIMRISGCDNTDRGSFIRIFLFKFFIMKWFLIGIVNRQMFDISVIEPLLKEKEKEN